MLNPLFDGLIVLAQQSSSSDSFLQELFSLIVLVCALTLFWIGLMVAIIRRSNQRRKAAKEGRPAPPSILESAIQSVRKWTDPQSAAARSDTQRSDAPQSAAPSPARGAASDALPSLMPDLDLLTSDLPQPDLETLFGGLDAAFPISVTSSSAASLAADPDREMRESLPIARDETFTHTPDLIPYEETAMSPAPDHDAPADASELDAIELLRVYRDLSDGSLIVQVGGRNFRALSDLRGTDLERRFLNVLRDLNQMARASFSSAARHAQTAPAPAAPPPATTEPILPAAPAPDNPAEPDSAVPSQADLDDLSMSPGTMLRQMTRVAMGHKPEPVEHTPLLSVAEQIEQVLQERLKGQPAFRGRSIHVWQALGGGVRIEVDGTFFEGVGEVADPAVRELILDVVREWENRR